MNFDFESIDVGVFRCNGDRSVTTVDAFCNKRDGIAGNTSFVRVDRFALGDFNTILVAFGCKYNFCVCDDVFRFRIEITNAKVFARRATVKREIDLFLSALWIEEFEDALAIIDDCTVFCNFNLDGFSFNAIIGRCDGEGRFASFVAGGDIDMRFALVVGGDFVAGEGDAVGRGERQGEGFITLMCYFKLVS